MTQGGIAVLAPIKEGQEESCRQLLEGINTGADGTITIDFAKQNRTHFTRFVILPDYDRGKTQKRLLWTAIFDGDQGTFFRDMRDNTSDIDALWKHCVDYPGKNFYVDYMEERNNPTGTFLKGHRFETVQSIQKYLAFRDDIIQRFDVPPAKQANLLKSVPRSGPIVAQGRSIWERVADFFTRIWRLILLLPAIVRLLRFGVGKVREAYHWVYGPFQLDRAYSDAPVDRSGPCVPFGPGDEVVPCKEEDALPIFLDRGMVQNQMTILTVNDPVYLKRQEAVLELIDILAALPFGGRNSGIPTIHFGRWLMIDGGRRMLFLSNYDGAWQTYIGDFVDKASRGLNAFWGGSYGWRNATTLDIELFKEGIRCHQTRASYFYCAYPQATVVNIGIARDLYKAYHNNINEKTAKELLKLL